MTRNVQTNFRAEDFEGAARPAKKRAAKKAAKKSAAPQRDPNEVPDGTSEEVLAWVGDDREKAKRALEKERRDQSPRTTLVEPLERMTEEPKPEKKAEPKAEKKAEKKAEPKKSAEADDK